MSKLKLALTILGVIACLAVMFGALATVSIGGFVIALLAMVGVVLLLLYAIFSRTGDPEDDNPPIE